MASGSRTKAYGLAALVVLALGLWWWLGRGPGSAGEGEDEGKGSESTDASAADALRPVPLRGKEIDPWQAPRAAVSGTVRDERGGPIAGAQVCARIEDDDLAGTERHPPQCTSTREDGSYRLEGLLGAEHHLFASARGYLPVRYESPSGLQRNPSPRVDLHAGSNRTDVDFVLAEGGVEVTGVVRDIAGGEVEGAFVSTSGRWNAGGATFTRSDAEGRFSLWVAPPEVWISAFAEGYGRGGRTAGVPGTVVEVFLTPESVVVGKVVWAGSGQPVAGAEVSTGDGPFGGGAGSTTSGEDGSFRLEGLPPGSHKLHVLGDELTGMSAERVHVGLGETSDPVVVEVHPAFAVRGNVTVDDRTPCSYASVRLQEKSRGTERYFSQRRADGAVLVRGVLPGTYEVTVSCEGFVPKDAYPDLVVADASLEGQSWSVHPGQSIRGKVVDAEGRPVAGARVSARGKAGDDPRARLSAATSQRTAIDGAFELHGLVPGRYELEPDHDELPSPTEPVVVELPAAGDVEGIELPLLAAGELRGIVRDEHGTAVGGVTVSLRGPAWNNATTNDEGRFVLRSVMVGEHRVVAQRGVSDTMRAPGASDDDAAGERVDVRANEVTEVELVVESQAGRIAGRVVAEGGEPVADAFVEAVRESDSAAAAEGGGRGRARWGAWSRQPVLTDEEGRFSLDGLAEQGVYTVLAYRKGGGEAVAEHVRAGADVELSIGEPGVLAGVVRIEGGGAPRRFTILAMDRSAGIRESDTFFETDGAWRLTNLPPGTYEVSVDAAEGTAKVDVELAEGAEETELELVLAPRVTLEGRLVDAETGEPVVGLKVLATAVGGRARFRSGPNASAQKDVSDAEGRFVVENAPTGKVLLMMVPIGTRLSEYGRTGVSRRVAAEPRVQDLGTMELVKERVGPGETRGDLGYEVKQTEPGTEPEDARRVVAVVRPGGPAEAAGLAVGDEIVSVEGQDVRGVEGYRYEKLVRVPTGTTVSLGVVRDGEPHTVKVVAGPPR